MLLFCGLLLIAIGIFRVAAPDIAWEIEHYFSVKGGEPTEFYLIGTRITGVVMIILGAVALVLLVLGAV